MGEMAQEAEDWALEEECRQSVLHGEPDQPTTPAPDRITPSDPQAAARDQYPQEVVAILKRELWQYDKQHERPDAPRSTVVA
jgi:hypothetical protein